MRDNDLESRTSTSSDTITEDSLYIPTKSKSSYLDCKGARCVCNLNVALLLQEHRWVGNADNLYESVGSCRSFHDEVDTGFFPFVLGGKCVEVGRNHLDEDNDEYEVDLEYSAEEKTVQCVACSGIDKHVATFTVYQSVLRFEDTKDGYTRPRLAWFMDFCDLGQTRCCVLWHIDGEKRDAEQGAVFGIWGAGGAHSRLTFRVVEKPKLNATNWFPCLENETTEGLLQMLDCHDVYIETIRKAEHDLRQQLASFGKPQWDVYGRWKFPDGVDSSTAAIDARCAACHDAPGADQRCNVFRLDKLVLKPIQKKEFRILAYKIDQRSRDARYIFFSKRGGDDALRLLKRDGTYTNLALRLVRKRPSTAQVDQFDKRACHKAPSLSPKNSDLPYSAFKAINEAGSGPTIAQNSQRQNLPVPKRSDFDAQTTISSDSLMLEHDDEVEREGALRLLEASGPALELQSDPSSSPVFGTSFMLQPEEMEERITDEKKRGQRLETVKKRKLNELLSLQSQWQLKEEYDREHRQNAQEEAEISHLDQQIATLKHRLSGTRRVD